RDVDIVINGSAQQLRSLMVTLQNLDYYADHQQAQAALSQRSQFNVIDNEMNWKVDFIFMEDTEYGRTAFSRREKISYGGRTVWVISAEDGIIAKLRWAQMGGSERQLQDVAGIVSMQRKSLDFEYLEKWLEFFRLHDFWEKAKT